MAENTECGLIVTSVTYAMRGRDVLARRGIKAFAERVEAAKTGCGCGYGLRVRADRDEAVGLLTAAKIAVKGYYEPE